jgi:hopene-associated glycosyltransferase HpnB
MLALAGLALLVWLGLLLGWHGFWKTDQRLPPTDESNGPWPAVACLIPARDEVALIGACLATVQAQRYPGALSITLVDDGSSDGTAEVARSVSGPRALTVLRAPDLKPGWTGKMGALDHGLTHLLGQPDPPAFIWLCDADIVHAPDTLTRLVAQHQRTNADLVSVMVTLHVRSRWERLLVPAFIYFFTLLYPFPAINRRASWHAGAAGGCILLRTAMIDRIGGWAALKGAVIDDCTLARRVKRAGGGLWLSFADTSRSIRAAEGLAPLWRMVARSAFAQLRHSWALLALTVPGLALVFLVPPLAVLLAPWHGQPGAALAGGIAWAGMATSYAPTLQLYGLPRWQALLLPLVAALYLAMTLDSALQHARGRGAAWKGRTYP